MGTGIDYTAVVAALQAKHSELLRAASAYEVAINAMKRIADAEARGTGSASGPMEAVARELIASASSAPKSLAQPYKGMSLAKAAFAHLQAVGKPQTTMQIAAALTRGGYESKSQNLTTSVYSRLFRYAQDGKLFVRQKDKTWALREPSDLWETDPSTADSPEEAVDRSTRAVVRRSA